MCSRPAKTGRLRLSKKLYNEKGLPPYPYKSAKSRDLCVAFCTSQGRGAPLVRWPDGHTFFAFLRTTGPARERRLGAEALRQPLAKTRKSGLGHFFDTLSRPAKTGRLFCCREKGERRKKKLALFPIARKKRAML